MHVRLTLTAAFAGFACIIAVGACAPEEGDVEQPTGTAEEAFSTSVDYEGTCAHLRAKSQWSQPVAAPNVQWGCTGIGLCDDNAKWMAGPSKSNCGSTVQVCWGGRCTQAQVKDVSSAGHWEAGPGVMSALQAPLGTLQNASVTVLSTGCLGQYAGYYCGGDQTGGNTSYLFYCPQKYAVPVPYACCANGCQVVNGNQDHCK